MILTLKIVLKIIVSLTLLNVWIFRFQKPSKWRGGAASNMIEEFKLYGLHSWLLYLVGSLKIIAAVFLGLSVWFKFNENIPLIPIIILLIGAIIMHIKIKDSYIKSIPAFLLLLLSLIIVYL